MTNHKAQRNANTLGNIIMTTLLTSAITIALTWHEQTMNEHVANAIATKQAALSQKQQEVTELKNMVDEQKVQIRELSNRGGSIQSVEASAWMPFSATFYDGRTDGWGSGQITRSGAPVKSEWTVAVDTHVIPLGSLVEVKFPNGEDRIFRAEDTGGAIKGHHIDVYEPDLVKCFANGIQNVMVRVLVRGH